MNMRQFFGRILGRELHRETRASVRLSDPHVAEFFGLGGGVLGHVDPARASGTAVAHRCVQLIAEDAAGFLEGQGQVPGIDFVYPAHGFPA